MNNKEAKEQKLEKLRSMITEGLHSGVAEYNLYDLLSEIDNTQHFRAKPVKTPAKNMQG